MGVKYSEQELANLISEVETQFSAELKKAEEEIAALAKSETETVIEPVVADSVETAVTYTDEDISEMNKMYSQMTKSEAELHYEAVKKAVFGEQAIEKSEKPVVEVKPAEVKPVIEKIDLTKSEEFVALKKESDEVKKQNEDLKKSIEALVVGLTKNIKAAPARKAITQLSEIDYIKKNETEIVAVDTVDVSKLTDSEISKRLVEKIREGKLNKKESDQINSYYAKEINLDAIKHLLQK